MSLLQRNFGRVEARAAVLLFGWVVSSSSYHLVNFFILFLGSHHSLRYSNARKAIIHTRTVHKSHKFVEGEAIIIYCWLAVMTTAPHSSRYPRPLRATHQFTPGSNGGTGSGAAPSPQQTSTATSKRYPPSTQPGPPVAPSPSSPGTPTGKKINLPLSPESPLATTRERIPILIPLRGG